MTSAVTRVILLSFLALEASAARQQDAAADAPTRQPEGGEAHVFTDGAARVRALGAGYRAVFGADAVALTPRERRSGDGDVPRLELRFLGSRRDGAPAVGVTRVVPARAEDQVRYHRGETVERYAIARGGYEQSFQVANRPAGSGDLVLSIAVGGNVTAPAFAASHRAIEFRCDDVPAIRYGEAFAFGRGGGRTEVLTRYDGVGRIELVVPARFVDTASYPIVVDPVVGPVFLPAGTSSSDMVPDVAYDLDNDRYMVVWEQATNTLPTNPYRTAMARIHRGDGSAVTAEFVVAPTLSSSRSPSVALCRSLTDEAFLVVFSSGYDIWGRLFDSVTGTALTNPFRISNSAWLDERPSVSGPGDGAMMVAWDRRAGVTGEPTQIVMRDLYWQFPTIPTAPSMGPERVLDQVTSGYVKNVRLAKSDVRMQVSGQSWFANRAVWERFWTSPAPGDFDVRTCSFRVRPSPSDFAFLQPTVGVASATSFDDEGKPDIGSRASLHQDASDMQFCIAWEEEEDVVAHMYDLFGPVGGQITVRATPDYEGMPAVGAGFCEFTIAYGEIVPPQEFGVDIRAARVLLDGTVAIDHRPVDVLGGPVQGQIRASSRPIHTVAEQETNTTLLTWWGQTGPSGTSAVNDVRARFFEPCAPSTFPFGSPCPGPLGELPTIGLMPTFAQRPIAGNEDFRLLLTGAPANSLAVLLISDVLTTIPIPGAPGCSLYAGLPLVSVLPAVTLGTGAANREVPLPCSIPSGTTLAFQWAIYSPQANAFGWIVSDDLDISWNH